MPRRTASPRRPAAATPAGLPVTTAELRREGVSAAMQRRWLDHGLLWPGTQRGQYIACRDPEQRLRQRQKAGGRTR